MTKALGLISDLHVLSRFGLVPVDWRQRRDPLRGIQDYLWDCYEDFVSQCPALDALLIVGDVVEGTVQIRAAPRGTVSDDAMDQLDACEETLRPLVAKARKTYLISGTPFHDASGERLEDLGRRLKTVAWNGRRYAGQVLNLDWQGLHINAAHHNTRGWMWLGGAASRIAVLSAAAEAAQKLPKADVIIRGDLHTSLKVETLGKWICFLPGWTMPSPYVVRKMEAVRAYLATDIGGAVLTVEGSQVGWLKDLTYPLVRSEVHVA